MRFIFVIIVLFLLDNFLPLPSYSLEDMLSDNNNLSDYNSNFPLSAESILSENVAKPIMLEARIDISMNLDLKSAIKLALENNLDLISAKFNKNSYKWKYIENIGNWLPDYSLGFTAQRLDGNFLIGGIFPVETLTSYVNAFMRFDYRFFEGGLGLFNSLASLNNFRSANENLNTFKNTIIYAVTNSYYLLLKEKAKLDVYSKVLKEAKEELDININLEKEGTGTKFEVLQSDAVLAEQEQLYILQQSKFRQASIHLSNLLNIEQSVHIEPSRDDLMILNLIDFKYTFDDFLMIAFDNRSEIKKAKYNYIAQKYYIGSAVSPFLPKANFFGQFGGTGNTLFHRTKIKKVVPDAILLDDEGGPLVQSVDRQRLDTNKVSNVVIDAGKPFHVAIDDSLRSNRILGVEIGWYVGDGLGVPTISKINQARYQAKIAKNEIQKIKNNIEEEVRQKYLNLQTSEKLLNVSKRRLESTTETLRLANLRLKNGIGINLELLTAQKQYSEALNSNVDSIIDYNLAQIALLYSIGTVGTGKI